MAEKTETTEQTDQLTGLQRKNAELLNEVKALKARVRELEGERDAATERADTAQAEHKRFLIDKPVEAVLQDLFVVPLRHVMPEVQEHFRFDLTDDGTLLFRTKDGEPVKVDGREAVFEREDIYRALCTVEGLAPALRASHATGGGAPGGTRPGSVSPQPTTRRVASPFGLR